MRQSIISLHAACSCIAVQKVREGIVWPHRPDARGRSLMPYVQRNSKREIVSLFANPQPGIAEEFVEEEHPAVQALRDELGATEFPSLLPSMSETRRSEKEHQAIAEDRAQMDAAVLHFLKCWSNLETALSALLYEALNIHPRTSRVAYAIYYSAPGFDARLKLLSEVFDQLATENPELRELPAIWQSVRNRLLAFKNIRHTVAHGAPVILAVEGRNTLRLTSPAFDVKRIGRPPQQGIPAGYSPQEIAGETAKVGTVQETIDNLNRLFTALHAKETANFQSILRVLIA
jgi:hypothetical protein